MKKKLTSEIKVQRLVQRLRQKPERRTTVKLRTLLSAFGYSRRSEDGVRTIREQLATEGVVVDLSVDSPSSLDDWIELREEAAGQDRTGGPPKAGGKDGGAGVEATPPPKQTSEQPDVRTSSAPPPAAAPATEPGKVPGGDLSQPAGVAEADVRRILSDLKNENAFAPVADSESVGAGQTEPPRSFAARLFRAALSLLEDAPPTTLGLTEGADAPPVAPPAAAVPSPKPGTRSPESRSSTPEPPRSALPAASPASVPPSRNAGAAAPAAHGTPELSSVAEQTIRATVFVQVENGYGSGFIAHPDGLVVTACHVLDSPSGIARSATIRTHDGRESTASLLTAHRSLDFALLWIDKSDKYPALPVGQASRTRYAETVLAVGHPGLRGGRALRNTVSTGVVANPACTERGVDWIQMTTDIDPGNSGGPLVNRNGEVIGINCWKFTDVSAAKMALPIDYLHEDLTLATSRGRDSKSGGRVCAICGAFDPDPVDWFCPTCGAAQAAASGGVIKGE